MTGYKGQDFYAAKAKEMCTPLDGMEHSDVLTTLTGVVTGIVGDAVDGNLDAARDLLDLIKSNVLDNLVENGWE